MCITGEVFSSVYFLMSFTQENTSICFFPCYVLATRAFRPNVEQKCSAWWFLSISMENTSLHLWLISTLVSPQHMWEIPTGCKGTRVLWVWVCGVVWDEERGLIGLYHALWKQSPEREEQRFHLQRGRKKPDKRYALFLQDRLLNRLFLLTEVQ